MDPLTLAIGLVFGLTAGFAVAWLWRAAHVGRLEVQLQGERAAAAEKLQVIQEAQARLRETFQALSGEALKSNNQAFLELARTSLGEFQRLATADFDSRQKAVGDLVKPIQDVLKQVDDKLQALEKERESAYRELRQQVVALAATEDGLRQETRNLAQALRSPKVQGRWGEVQLRRVVELAGMLEHCDFTEQTHVASEGGRLRPDLIVMLPGNRRLIVDAKAPLNAFLDAHEATDDSVRNAALDEHARLVREHIKSLGSKAYWEQFEDAPDFVVMFIPGEAFFAAAFERDAELLEFGYRRNVIPASPTSLISILKSAHFGWQQEKVAVNAQEIRQLGTELYDRLRVMAEHYANLGTHLNRAVEAYDQTTASFERRVLVQARRLKELGAGGDRDVPPADPVNRAVRPLLPADPADESPPH